MSRVVEQEKDEHDGERKQGREDEARRFELMQRTLPPVRSEKQLIADALISQRQIGKGKDSEQDRAH